MMPILFAIGGHTATGKTTLAYALSKAIPELRDALLIEDDQVRREILGCDLKTKMKPEDYDEAVSRRVREEIDGRILQALKKETHVVDSSGFYSRQARRHIEGLAALAEVPFYGLWLVASRKSMVERIEKRLAERETMAHLSLTRGHASDACLGVIEKFGDIGVPVSPLWHVIPADGSLAEVVEITKERLFADGIF